MRASIRIVAASLGLAATLFSVGCGGSGSGSSTQVPPPAGSQGSQSYNYVGTQSLDASYGAQSFNYAYGGTWAVTLDDSTDYFSYENIGHNVASATVGTTSGSGFESLTASTAGATPGAAGYVLEIPGEAALLRPGDDTVAPVISAITNGCPNLTSPTTYQFISLGTPAKTDKNTHVAYGSVQASNSGTVWNFTNLNMYTFGGVSLSPTPLPVGNCGYTQLGYAISMASSTTADGLTVTTAVSPNGFFIMDQGQGEPGNIGVLDTAGGGSGSFGPTGPLGLVGVEQPSSQLSTSSIVAGKYLGFEFDPINLTLGRVGSMPVAFGQTAGSGTTMIGGAFPNDDVTQTAPSNITVNLGQQDSQNNGLYKSVIVTLPDVYGGCIGEPFGGVDTNGNPTCTFPGEAVIGNPGGKFAIFITVNDLSQAVSHYTADAALDFFLYQQ